MFRNNESGTKSEYEELRFLRVQSIVCEDLIQNFGTDASAGKVRFTSNLTAEGDVDFQKNFSVGGIITAVELNLNSDRRLKSKIEPILLSQSKHIILNSKLYKYELKDKNKKKHVGVIAQEIQKLDENLVRSDSNGILSVNYIELLVHCLNVIQDLENRLSQHENKSFSDPRKLCPFCELE